MPRIRTGLRTRLHHSLGAVATAWTRESFPDPVNAYAVKHGIRHLLHEHDRAQAEERLLDLDFMAAHLDAWPSVEQPLAAWRVVGLDAAVDGYSRVGRDLLSLGVSSSVPASTAARVLQFLCDAGLFKGAVELAEWSRSAAERTAGAGSLPHHRATGRLAEVYAGLARYGEADALYQAAVDGLRRPEGGFDTEALVLVRRFSHMLSDWGDNLERAGRLMEEAVASLRQPGQPTADLAGALIDLGYTYARTGRRPDAEALFTESIALMEPSHGVRNGTVLYAKHLLAWVWRTEKRYEAAADLFCTVLRLRQSTLGSAHPSTAVIHGNLAGICIATDRLEQALDHNGKALAAQRSALGPLHRDVLVARHRHGWILEEMGRLSDAADAYRSVWSDAVEGLGVDNSVSVQAGCCLAGVLAALEQHDEACRIYEGILALNPTTYGAKLFPYARVLTDLAQSLRALDRPADAARHRRRCWAIECADDGPAASGTLQTAHALVRDLLAADRPDEARAVARDALNAAASATDDDDDRAEWVAKLTDLQA